ncbi:MAG: DUF6194 family protein [Lactobacillus sp.]|jgi:hypothetical protein|nr:DUF6194 family protein [Lactobacillus sp.]MCI2031953.1 DUF6194 family protein [Lactobacillus sp.]
MNQADFEAFVAKLPNVEREDNFGYAFFFVGSDHRLPFVSFAAADNAYDAVSQLDRAGIFRINIGVSKASFQALVGESSNRDYTAVNTFLPHPQYAARNFICILNPEGPNVQKTKTLIEEAHALASRQAEKTNKH